MAMLNNQRVSFLFMSSDVSCQKYPNPAGYEPRQTAAEKSWPVFWSANLRGGVENIGPGCRGDGEGLSDVFFARHHDQPRHRSDMNFTFGHWNIEIENWLVVSNIFYFSIQLGMSSSQLTKSIIFQRGCFTTNLRIYC